MAIERKDASCRIRCIPVAVYLILTLFVAPTIGATDISLTAVTQTFGWFDSTTTPTHLDGSTSIEFSGDGIGLDVGMRIQLPVWDIGLATSFFLKDTDEPLRNMIVTKVHSAHRPSFGSSIDVVGGYGRIINIAAHAMDVSISYGLGIQVSATFMPFLDMPLINFSPYYDLEITLEMFDSLMISTSIGSSTLFEYSTQAMSPVAKGSIAYDLTDAITVGCEYSVHFSDILPETFIIAKQEAKAYVVWIPKVS
ncbi:MAG: hypothetical protein PHR01_02590 [Sphaerochaetaceae bacterium]|nr:hypothetical protein [Sphaerochaetaceae bacterium]